MAQMETLRHQQAVHMYQYRRYLPTRYGTYILQVASSRELDGMGQAVQRPFWRPRTELHPFPPLRGTSLYT